MTTIPQPPMWVWFMLLAAAMYLLGAQAAHAGATPYYTGKPPPSPHYKGRCWCVVHGPRGGCIHWSCKPQANR